MRSEETHFSNVFSWQNHTCTLYLTGGADHMICGNFAINASFKSCGIICLPRASYSGILRNFSTAEPSTALKIDNSSLSATWNTTQCEVASFFLFSLHLLSTNLPRTSVSVRVSVAHALFQANTCTKDSALQRIHWHVIYMYIHVHVHDMQ